MYVYTCTCIHVRVYMYVYTLNPKMDFFRRDTKQLVAALNPYETLNPKP